ncbi:MAG: LysR family transcriptional regulator [Bacteriovorax sp.]|nr:LysR family transcriptional regulator [Bacteriovorax sp.]
METRELKAFITVAEELNFRKAAERLNITQPPLTRIISKLETDLNVKLFNRTTRSVELTGAGLHLLKKGKEILAQISNTELEVRNLQKNKSGKLHLSLNFGAVHSDLPRLISSFKEQFPKITVVVVEFNFSALAKNLRSTKIDVAFCPNIFKEQILNQVPIQSHEIGLLISKENPLSQKKSLKLSDLEGETLIYHGKHEHLGFQEEFLEFLKLKDVRPRIYYKKSKESCSILVGIGKGLLLTSKRAAHITKDAVFIPLAEYSPRVKFYATWSLENPSLALKAFINFLEEKAPSSEMDGHLS